MTESDEPGGSRSKPRRANELGPIGERVAENVAQIRRHGRLTTQDVSDRLAELGRVVHPSAITRIEGRGRRVDVDDLVALALALDSTPNRLMLNERGPCALTPVIARASKDAWRWAADAGAPFGWVTWWPLHGGDESEPLEDRIEAQKKRGKAFQRRNRPDRQEVTFEQGAAHLQRLLELSQEVSALARKMKVSRRQVLETLADISITGALDHGQR